MAVLAAGTAASSAVLVYTIAYSLATVAAFGTMILVKKERGTDDLSGFNGLARTNPLLAFVLTLSMFSMDGIPLTAGFFGMFSVFKAIGSASGRERVCQYV